MDVSADNRRAATRVSPLRTVLLALAAISAMPNGLFFSPWFDSVLFMLPRASSAFLVTGDMATFYLTGVLLWLITLALAGIPAALYERIVAKGQPTIVPMLVWMLTALVLSIPSFRSAMDLFAEPY